MIKFEAMERLFELAYKLANKPVTINGREYPFFESRGERQYNSLLFPDNPINIRGLGLVGCTYVQFIKSMLGREDKFRLYKLDANDINDFTQVEAVDIRKTVPHQDKLFKPGSTILDLGSGAGRAVKEYKRRYRRTYFIGIDPQNGSDYPAYSSQGDFVGGVGRAIPFADNVFDGVLACESFPRWVSSVQSVNKTISELTRVCKPGAQFRATDRRLAYEQIPSGEDWNQESYVINKMDAVVTGFVNQGWEVLVSQNSMIAVLKDKNRQYKR